MGTLRVSRKEPKERMRAAFERRYASKGALLSFKQTAPNRWRVSDAFYPEIYQDFDTSSWRIRAVRGDDEDESDFPADDSGATEHVVEPVVSHDAEDEVLARLIALFSAPWPFVPAYV